MLVSFRKLDGLGQGFAKSYLSRIVLVCDYYWNTTNFADLTTSWCPQKQTCVLH